MGRNVLLGAILLQLFYFFRYKYGKAEGSNTQYIHAGDLIALRLPVGFLLEFHQS